MTRTRMFPHLARAAARALALGTFALALLASACSDSTGPGDAIQLQLRVVENHGPTIYDAGDGTTRVECTVDFRAVATGKGSLSWGDAEIRWFAGADRSEAFDTTIIAREQVIESWGDARLSAGDSVDVRWELSVSAPFTAEVAYRFRPGGGGREQKASVPVDCGIGSASLAPPVIDSVVIEPASGPIEPGKALAVSLHVSGAERIWETSVTLEGPCAVTLTYREDLRHEVSRTVPLAIPSSCQLGVPVSVTVRVTDAALRTTSRVIALGRSLVDATPPSLEVRYFGTSSSGFPLTRWAGHFFTGDTLVFQLFGGDNHSLRSMSWDVLPVGFTDSLTVFPDPTPVVKIPVLAGWNGPIQVRFRATDGSGLTSPTVESEPGAMHAHPDVARPTTWRSTAFVPLDAAIDEARGVAWVIAANLPRVHAISIPGAQITPSLDLPSLPTSIDVAPDGSFYVAAMPYFPAIAVVDVRSSPHQLRLVPLTLDATVTQTPLSVRLGSNGKAYVLTVATVAAARQLLEVDLATGTQRTLSGAFGDGIVDGVLIERSLDYTRLQIAGGTPRRLQTLDLVTGTFGPVVAVADRSGGLGVDDDGSTIAVGFAVFTGGMQPQLAVPALADGVGSTPTALTADGATLFRTYGKAIVAYRTSDGTIASRTRLSFRPSVLRASRDGRWLLAIAGADAANTGDVAVIDLR